TSFVGTIEVSYDGVLFTQQASIRLTISEDATNNTSTKIYWTAGAYPYVRFRKIYFHSVSNNCKVSIFYSGSLSATPLTDAVNYNVYGFVGIVNDGVCRPILQFPSRSDSPIKLATTTLTFNNISNAQIGVSVFSTPTCDPSSGVVGIT